MDKSALNRATDSTSAPTPGYLYNDIARSLLTPQACTDTLRFLSAKLSKNNPHVKKKALKVLTKAAAHPATRGRFKRCIVQDPQTVAAIKECTSFRGTMDAVTGDQWNLEVREAAKECLDVIYSDDGGEQVGMTGLSGQGGFGSVGFGGGGGAYGAPMGGVPGSGVGAGGAPSKYEGIGNPMYKDPRMDDGRGVNSLANMTVTEVVGNVGSAMLEMIKDPLARNVPPNSGSPNRVVGYGGPNLRPDPYSSNPPGRNNLATQTGGQWTMASNRGPNAVGPTTNAAPPSSALQQNSEYYKAANAAGSAFQWAGAGAAATSTTPGVSTNSSASGVGGSWASAAPTPPQSQLSVAARSRAEAHGALPVTSNIPAGPATSNGTYEKNLIDELCPPGGMKAEPPPDKLQEFARAVPSLNPDCVCPALLDALEEGNPWIMRAKALCVIETVLQVMAEVEGSNAYADFFHACSEEIAPLTNHARAAVKAPAKRVMALLGLNDAGVGVAVATGRVSESAVAAVPAVEAPNLLDFDEPPAPAVAAPVAPPPPPIHATPQPAVTSGGDSLFSGLNTKAAAPSSDQPILMAPAASSSAHDGDLLGGLDDIASPSEAVPPTNSTSAAPSNDLFGDLSVKAVEYGVSNTPHPASAPPTAPSSAFGFMNNTAPPAPPAETPMTPSTPATQTFDPLLSLGTPGSINPSPGAPNPNRMSQIQATMAYQQQMIMMQQQMQQMQMVYAGAGGAYGRQVSGAGVPPLPIGNTRPNVMGANYMRQVPGVQGDKMTSFTFLGTDPKKQENHSFDFVKDAMKKG